MKLKISIARISTNPTIRFVSTDIGKNFSKNDLIKKAISQISCSGLSDNKTTYVQKKVWNIALNKYTYPPYVDCGYVV